MSEKANGPGYTRHSGVIDAARSRSVDLSGTAFPSHTNAPQVQVTENGKPQTTLMESLTQGTGIKLSVDATNISQHKLSTSSSPSIAASTQVASTRQTMSGISTQVADTKSVISDTIRQAQKEVTMAAGMAGLNASEIYPDNRIAGSELGMMMQVAGPAAMNFVFGGAGGAIAAVANATVNLDTIIGDRKGIKNRATAEAEIRDKLTMKSSNPQMEQNFSAVMTGLDPKKDAPQPSRIDWKAFLEEHDLADLMSLDPDNPDPAIVPEWGELSLQEMEIAEVNESLDHVEAHKYDAGNTGEMMLAIKTGNIDTAVKMADIETNISAFIPGLTGAKIAAPDAEELTAKMARLLPASEPSLNQEFKPFRAAAMPASNN